MTKKTIKKTIIPIIFTLLTIISCNIVSAASIADKPDYTPAPLGDEWTLVDHSMEEIPYESLTETDYIYVDADGDGRIGISDATCMQRLLCENETKNGTDYDVNHDGDFNIIDVSCLQQVICEYV